jgi:hypothetical protein
VLAGDGTVVYGDVAYTYGYVKFVTGLTRSARVFLAVSRGAISLPRRSWKPRLVLGRPLAFVLFDLLT